MNIPSDKRRRSLTCYNTDFDKWPPEEDSTIEESATAALQFKLSPEETSIPRSPFLQEIRLYLDDHERDDETVAAVATVVIQGRLENAVVATTRKRREWDMCKMGEREVEGDELVKNEKNRHASMVLDTLKKRADKYKRRAEEAYNKYIACLEEIVRQKQTPRT